ncbi:ABC transporter ATP-binding protein [Desulforudis sp. 1088]|uniref:ABC transporter ATP-binding protein n=1 Tax=unclassified Candidatus Desulforudis TaxID=2635950 RepID=UPI003CE49651
MPGDTILQVCNLTTQFTGPGGVVKAVNGVTFHVKAGQTLGVVGESGCGKSVMCLSLIGLIDPPGRIAGGEVWLDGKELLRLSPGELRRVRGREIALVFQDPMSSLNPVLTVGTQLTETIVSHVRVSRAKARRAALRLLAGVGLPDPERLMRRYPFQLSGGMRQRVMIAMALSLRPKVLIADEPTTALDVTVQAQILGEMKRLQKELGTALILVTHDLGVIAAMADTVAVMYAGSIVEYGPCTEVFTHPGHPYTKALLRAVPRLGADDGLVPIPGQPPNLLNLPDCCAFLPRCPLSGEECRGNRPRLHVCGPEHRVACHRSIGELQPYGEDLYEPAAGRRFG